MLKVIQNIIDNYKANPENFGNNVWRCYEACKRKIYGDYESAIDYIVKELGI